MNLQQHEKNKSRRISQTENIKSSRSQQTTHHSKLYSQEDLVEPEHQLEIF